MLAIVLLAIAGLAAPFAQATQVATTTALAVSPSGTVPTKTVVTLTATVVPASGAGTITQGTVSFFDHSGALFGTSFGSSGAQSQLLGTAQVQANGTAVFSTILPSSTHNIEAIYMPTPQGTSSSSAAATVVVAGGTAEQMYISATAGGAKGNYSVSIDPQYMGVSAPAGTFHVVDLSASNAVLATGPDLTTYLAPGNLTGYNAGFRQGTLPALAGANSTIAVADLNRDGIPDLVAANGTTLGVFHGVGDGSFTGEVDYTIPSGTSAVATGDVNNDGYADVILTNGGNNTISVYLNNGNGTLGTPATYAVSGPGKIFLGNFGSGYLDIATMTSAGIVILPNNGNGTYGTAQTIVYSTPLYMAMGDLNGDGYPDFVISRGGNMSVFLSQGNGNFQLGFSTSGSGVSLSEVMIGDFNDDGFADIGILDTSTTNGIESLLIFSGNGSGTSFNPDGLLLPFSYELNGSLRGDGFDDFVFVNGSTVSVLVPSYGHFNPSSLMYSFDTAASLTSTGGPNGPIVSLLGDGLGDFFADGEWIAYRDKPFSLSGLNVVSTTSLAPHTLDVQFTPVANGSYAPTVSNTVSVVPYGQVLPVVTASPSALSYNTGVLTTTLTATMAALSSTYPTGSIQFYDNGNAIGTSTLSNGVATLSLANPSAGSHPITAVYSGDSNYITTTSAAYTLVVTPETPALTIASSASSQIVGGVVTLTGTIGSNYTNVAGVVLQFDIAGGNTATCTVTSSGLSGGCSVQVAVPTNGSLQAHVTNVLDTSGHPNLASHTSAMTLTGTQVAGNVGIQSSTNPSYSGQSVTITLTAPTLNGISGNGATSVYDNGTLLQTVSFASSSAATITTTAFTVGTHTLTTHYNGDSNGRTLPNGNVTTVASFTAATGSTQLNQVVVTATLSLPLTVTPQSTTEGTQQTLSVFVNNSGVGITGAVVQFFDASSNPTLLGSATVGSSGSSTGVATWRQLFSPGTHSFYVVVTLPGAGLTTSESSRVAATVTPATMRPLALSLAETGQPGNYTSTVTANYHSNYPLGGLSLLNASNGNTSLANMTFGAPSYALPTSGSFLNAGIGALSVATGDVNHDGKTDLVVGNYWDETVSVYLGNGDGTFQTPNVISLGLNSPDKLILGDFDGDGNLDVYIICDYQQSGNIWFGDGTGNFSQTSTTGMNGGVNVPIDATDTISVDMDKDGIPDLASVGFGFSLNLSSQNFNFVGAGTAGSPVWVATADFNNDGNPDLVTADLGGGVNTTNSIAVLLGDGTGNLPTITNLDIPGTPGGVTTGDFDEDGNPDIAVALYDTQQIAIFRGKGDGTFFPYTLIASGGTVGAQGIKAIDLDGDGSLDLVLLDTSMVLGNYDGAQPPGVSFGYGNQFVTTSSGNVLYLRGDGNGNFDAAQTINVGSGTTPVFLAMADFDGDGVADLAVPQTSGFDDLNNTSTASTVGIFLGSNTAQAVLAGSSAVNTAGPVQIKAEHVHGSPDAYATTYSNTVQLQSLTTAAITSSAQPSPLGSTLTLSATVATVGGVVPTGTVQFFNGATNLGTGTISSGVATVTTSSLTIGGHTITAFYSGDAHFLSTSATALNQTISPAATTVALTSSANPAHYGAAVTLTATESNNAATGTVKFMSGATLLGTGQLSSGVATFTTSSLPIGTSSLTAAYLGDSNYGAATSTALSQVINLSNAATTALGISPASAVYGQIVTMTATLGASAATGSVTFTSGATTLGTASVANGVATFNINSLNVGTYSVTAAYSGDSYYSGSTSAAASVTITQATPSLSSVVVLPASAAYGSSVTLTQSVPAGATGTVTFYANGTSLGTATISGGVAALTTTSLPSGTNTITASYGGNANFTSATSSGSNAVITPATPNLSAPTASPSSASYGTSVTLTQAVPSGMTGNITFLVNGTPIGSGTIAGGVATLTTTALPAGTNAISTSYSGNANYTSGTSASGSVVITAITTATTLSLSPTTSTYGTAVTFTATVTAGGNPVTAGSVSFTLNGVSQGTASVNGSGVATITLNTLNVGSNPIVANFGANGSDAASASSSATAVVTQATPVIVAPTASPTSASYGASVTLTQTVPAGATGTVTFSANGLTLGTATISGGVATLNTSALPAGANTLSTSYSGNTNYAAATSANGSIVIAQATPTLAAPAATPSTPTYGASVTLSQTVPVGVTGTVTFLANGVNLGSATISGSVATLTTSALPVGTNSVVATYGGNSNYTSATSATASVVVGQATPTLGAPTASPSATAAYGSSITLTLPVPNGVTGTVTFQAGSVVLGTATISAGVATLTTSAIPAGNSTVQAVYNGNTNFSSATSLGLPVSITAIPTNTSLTISPAISSFGSSVTFTVAVTPGSGSSPSGTVNLTISPSGAAIGTVTVTNGAGTMNSSTLGVQSGTVTATFVAGNNYASSSSSPVSLSVTQATPSLAAPAVSPTAASFGSPVTLTQTVPAGATGTVTFSANGVTLGTATVVSGVGTITTTALPAGVNAISASYGGNANYTSATSASANITIAQATPALSAPAVSPTTANFGSPVTLTQTLPSGATGTVTFSSGNVTLGTAQVVNGAATLTTSTLPTGSNSITASYGGNANYTSATSASTNITIAQAAPTLSAPVVSPTAANFGSPVTLTQTLPSGATGTVTFTSGNVTLGAAPVINGAATLTTSTLPAGSNSITASYGGNANYTSATSPAANVTITPVTPTLAAPSALPSTAAYGTSVTLTQALPSGATGTVTFLSGSTVLGTVTISNGVATLSTAAMTAGSNIVTCSYSGNGSYAAATSLPLAVNITQATALLPAPVISPTTATYGNPVTIAQNMPSGATGSVTSTSGSTVLGSAPIVNGVATLVTSSLPGGNNVVTSSYAGNANYAPSTSAPSTISVAPATLTLSSPVVSPSTAVVGSPVTLAQSFPSGATGTVTFMSGTTVLGTATITNGVATLTTSIIPVGTNAIIASFPGNNNFVAAVSAATSVTMNATSVSLSAPIASPGTAPYGTPVTLTQTVPGGVTGTITFTVNGNPVGSAAIANGVATLTTSTLPGGTNAISSVFGGNAQYPAATSAAGSVTITPASLMLPAPAASPSNAGFGTSVTLTQQFPAGATGSVTFTSGGVTLGTATILNGVATLTTAALQGGTNPVSVSYPGNANYASASSAAASVIIAPANLTLPAPTVSPANATVGAVITITQPFPAGANGTVTFSSSGVTLGTATIANGVATLTTTTLPAGTDSITTSYPGSNNFTSATSSAATIAVAYGVAPGYTITANPPSLTLHAGQSASTTLTFTPIGGFTGSFTMQCNNLPANASCTFQQPGAASNVVSMTNPNQPVQVTLTVNTDVTATQAALRSNETSRPHHGATDLAMIMPFGVAGLLVLRRRRHVFSKLVTVLLLSGGTLVAVASLSGCSGGFGLHSTPPGASAVTVTATASASATIPGTSASKPANNFVLNITILP